MYSRGIYLCNAVPDYRGKGCCSDYTCRFYWKRIQNAQMLRVGGMKYEKIINRPETVVTEMCKGLVLTNPDLEFVKKYKVIRKKS